MLDIQPPLVLTKKKRTRRTDLELLQRQEDANRRRGPKMHEKSVSKLSGGEEVKKSPVKKTVHFKKLLKRRREKEPTVVFHKVMEPKTKRKVDIDEFTLW